MLQMDTQLRAMADGTRRAILQRTWDAPVAAGDLARGFAISRPAVSRHLRVLREAGLVVVHEAGTSRLYAADREAVAQLRAMFERFWDQGLPKLKAVVEKERQ